LSPDDLALLYQNKSGDIFPWGWKWLGDRLARVMTQGVSAPLYSQVGLEKTLKDALGDKTLGEVSVRILLPAYSISSGKPVIFDSLNPEHKDIPLWECVRASSAAPVFFPAHVIRVAGQDHILMDGGLVFNNPSLLGAILAEKDGASESEIEIFSFGTGEAPPIDSLDLTLHGGILEWGLGLRLIPVLMDASLDAVNLLAEQHYVYHRVQASLPAHLYAIDNARPENIKALQQLATESFGHIQFLADVLRD